MVARSQIPCGVFSPEASTLLPFLFTTGANSSKDSITVRCFMHTTSFLGASLEKSFIEREQKTTFQQEENNILYKDNHHYNRAESV
jgi:hypothetical protein